MTRDDIRKLLGGYATGTLTPEEQQALFAAALDDQELFDALAKEQALRDLLRDPAARAHVLAAIDQRPEPWWQRVTRWMLRPAAVGAVAGCLAAVAGYGIWHARQTGKQAPVLMAENRPAQVAPVPSAPVAEPPAPVEERAPIKSAVRRPAGTAAPAASAPAAAPSPPPVKTLYGVSVDDAKKTAVIGSLNQPVRDQGQAIPAAPMMQQSQVSQQSVPSQTEAVTVTAAAPVVQAPAPPGAPVASLPLLPRDKAEIAADALMANNFRATPMGLSWSALRREADGRLSPVEPDQVRAGDAIVLRLVAAMDGQLSVFESVPDSTAPRMIMGNTRVERAKPVDTPPVTLDHPGDRELLVRFTALAPVSAQSTGAVGGGGARMARSQAVAAKDSASAPPPALTITLHYR
jgi:hypothetical protein